jgi:hypothetical protein
MKRSCPSLILLILLLLFAAAGVAGQARTRTRPTSFIETRQANDPDGPDVTGHGKVSQGDTLLCKLVSVYEDGANQTSSNCMIRFGGGPRHTLAFNQSMRAPQDGEAYLECAGDRPRRCIVEVNPWPSASPPPGKAD